MPYVSRQPNQLLTTHLRAGVAVVLAALLLMQVVRAVLTYGSQPAGWLVEPYGLLHGRPLVAVNIALYGYVCWLAYWFIRGTHGRERFFMVAGFASLLLWPLKTVQHGWILEVRYINVFGYSLALVIAISLLIRGSRSSTWLAAAFMRVRFTDASKVGNSFASRLSFAG